MAKFKQRVLYKNKKLAFFLVNPIFYNLSTIPRAFAALKNRQQKLAAVV
jgi:hypothetical protein